MGTTQIYLIRHGESQANAVDAFLGHDDLDLTEKGQQQARLAAAYLRDIPVDVVYSSDLKRAYHTALPTARMLGMEILCSSRLREISGGEWEQVPFRELEERYPEAWNIWVNDIGNAVCPGGESVLEMQSRFTAEVERLARENEGKTIFIFTHSTPIRVLKAAWDGKTVDEIKDVPWAGNASVTHGEYADGIFRILSYGVNDFLKTPAATLPNHV